MQEYLSPGVYIEETASGPRPIEGIGTTTAAFVGFAASGPANQPVLVTNWSQFRNTFGALGPDGARNPHMPGAYLSHAVYGYFNNGGTRCYVTRVVPPQQSKGGKDSKTIDQSAPLQLPTRASKAVSALTIEARGNSSNDISVEVLPAASEGDGQPGEGVFTIKVKAAGAEETFENVSISKKHARNVVEVVNQASKLIEITEQTTSGALAERVPELGAFVIKSSAATSATDLTVQSNDFIGSLAERSGIDGLEIAEDVSMICVPDLMSAYQNGLIDQEGVKSVQLAMINHCERNQNRVAILDPLPDLTPQEVKRWRETDTNFDSAYGTLYYPWVKVNGPDGASMAVPPSGHVAGIYARSDVERGVHKAPANEVVRGALDPVMQITKGEQDVLNPIGVNCIRSFTGMGVRVWGARTLSSDARWRYISVRRLFSMVERSIERGTQWAVFEPNDVMLWSKVRRDITAFLTTVWRDGALFGTTAGEAFYVKCDAELNPPEVRDRGVLMIEIGLAPVKPAEFVVFRFSQYAGGGQ